MTSPLPVTPEERERMTESLRVAGQKAKRELGIDSCAECSRLRAANEAMRSVLVGIASDARHDGAYCTAFDDAPRRFNRLAEMADSAARRALSGETE